MYNSFSNYDIDLIDNTFVIVINNGEGISLEGKLKSSVCDNSTLNNRYALLQAPSIQKYRDVETFC